MLAGNCPIAKAGPAVPSSRYPGHLRAWTVASLSMAPSGNGYKMTPQQCRSSAFALSYPMVALHTPGAIGGNRRLGWVRREWLQ
jgi:hypothetical protein